MIINIATVEFTPFFFSQASGARLIEVNSIPIKIIFTIEQACFKAVNATIAPVVIIQNLTPLCNAGIFCIPHS